MSYKCLTNKQTVPPDPKPLEQKCGNAVGNAKSHLIDKFVANVLGAHRQDLLTYLRHLPCGTILPVTAITSLRESPQLQKAKPAVGFRGTEQSKHISATYPCQHGSTYATRPGFAQFTACCGGPQPISMGWDVSEGHTHQGAIHVGVCGALHYADEVNLVSCAPSQRL